MELTVFHSDGEDDDEIEVEGGGGYMVEDVGGGVVGGGLVGDGVVLLEVAGGGGVDCGKCRGLAGDDVVGAVSWSFLRNISRRLAFLLMVDGLGFFLVRALPWVSEAKEKEKPEPKVRESWVFSAWQRSRHLVAKSSSLTAAIFEYF